MWIAATIGFRAQQNSGSWRHEPGRELPGATAEDTGSFALTDSARPWFRILTNQLS